MSISALDLITYLGHSSIHEPFDEFLHENGVTKRPKIGGQTYDPYIEVKNQGLHLCFITSNELKDEGLLAKSPGTYVFHWLDIYLQKESGFAPFKGALPFGLDAKMNQQQVRELLGPPLHVTINPERKTNVDFYFKDGLVLAIKYSDMEGSQINSVNPRLPDNWAREHSIAPVL